MDKRTQENKKRLLESLEKGMAQVHLDARRPFVGVPERFKDQPQLVLNISYRFEPPDLTISDWGVRETLSFGGERFMCGIPWSAIFAVASVVTREFWMYPDDMPSEVMANAVEKYGGGEVRAKWPKTKEEEAAAAAKPKTVLREVVLEKSDDDETDDEPKEGPKDPPEPPKRGHLRVVK
jgi:stringent starvation protein B